MALSRTTIAHAALRLLDEVGLDALTTRRLGTALGVEGPALYRHFRTKQDLIDEMANVLFEDVRATPFEEDWAVFVEKRMRRIRHIILSHRDGARLVTQAWPRPGAMGDLTRPFLAAGFSQREALYCIMVVGRFVIGWTSAEQANLARDQNLAPHLDNDDAFNFGVETILAGLRLRLLNLPRRQTPMAMET